MAIWQCGVFCIFMLTQTNRYQKNKSVGLGDQIGGCFPIWQCCELGGLTWRINLENIVLLLPLKGGWVGANLAML